MPARTSWALASSSEPDRSLEGGTDYGVHTNKSWRQGMGEKESKKDTLFKWLLFQCREQMISSTGTMVGISALSGFFTRDVLRQRNRSVGTSLIHLLNSYAQLNSFLTSYVECKGSSLHLFVNELKDWININCKQWQSKLVTWPFLL
ncbi:hypothetical protein RRG08_051376 [Elysia crispata]|uniref:Uncharacterized protein n=1 Tax=Elysia crispata TaxID=231223 RepID=A0AAE1B413_9GAST|nr:hypothetical protein RRG08_051376 [Elysia crispata]